MFSGQVVEALATVIKKEKEEDEDNKGEFKFFKCGRGNFVRSFMFLMSSDSSLQWKRISQILSLNFRFHHFELDF